MTFICLILHTTGADPGFQVMGGMDLKKLGRAEGGANIFGVFRVKNHFFMPKNHIFTNFRRGAHAGCGPPPWIRPCTITVRVANDHFSHLKNNQLKKSFKIFKG